MEASGEHEFPGVSALSHATNSVRAIRTIEADIIARGLG